MMPSMRTNATRCAPTRSPFAAKFFTTAAWGPPGRVASVSPKYSAKRCTARTSRDSCGARWWSSQAARGWPGYMTAAARTWTLARSQTADVTNATCTELPAPERDETGATAVTCATLTPERANITAALEQQG